MLGIHVFLQRFAVSRMRIEGSRHAEFFVVKYIQHKSLQSIASIGKVMQL